MFRVKYNYKRTYIGNIPKGEDLYDALTKIALEEDIRTGKLIAIGAVTEAVIGFFDQKLNEYNKIFLSTEHEILNCSGNISLKEGKPFVHAHIILGDKDGKVFGGHLMNGTKVFACEVIIDEYSGEDLNREKDNVTGLFLWRGRSLI
ncbi:MAG: hypothetical protein IGBAC_1211 [Ignavibacteriae bacterium]|nr:MAG: hypothetical protein IGBAC_1211 [Ignavibacteriota bacterium]